MTKDAHAWLERHRRALTPCPACGATGIDPARLPLLSHPEALRRCTSCHGFGYVGKRRYARKPKARTKGASG